MKFKDKVEQFFDKAGDHGGYFLVALLSLFSLTAIFAGLLATLFKIFGTAVVFTVILVGPIILALILILKQKEE